MILLQGRYSAHYNVFRSLTQGGIPMSAVLPKSLVEVPDAVWTALRLKPGARVKWEVRGSEAVMRAARKDEPAVIPSAAGMLAPKFKGRRIDWRAAERSAAAAWGKLR